MHFCLSICINYMKRSPFCINFGSSLVTCYQANQSFPPGTTATCGSCPCCPTRTWTRTWTPRRSSTRASWAPCRPGRSTSCSRRTCVRCAWAPPSRWAPRFSWTRRRAAAGCPPSSASCGGWWTATTRCRPATGPVMRRPSLPTPATACSRAVTHTATCPCPDKDYFYLIIRYTYVFLSSFPVAWIILPKN